MYWVVSAAEIWPEKVFYFLNSALASWLVGKLKSMLSGRSEFDYHIFYTRTHELMWKYQYWGPQWTKLFTKSGFGSTCKSSWPKLKNQYSGSVTFLYGYGSSDPYIWLSDPDPALFSNSELQDAIRKIPYIILINNHKKSQKKKSRFFFLFLLDDGRIRIRTSLRLTYPGGPRTYGSRSGTLVRIRTSLRLTYPGGPRTYGSRSGTLVSGNNISDGMIEKA